MNEDDLLKRFAALRAPTLSPSDPRASTEAASKRAEEEDDELERIADGRGPSVQTVARAQGEEVEDEDKAMQRRLALLRGEEMPLNEDELELGDDEVEAYIASLSSTTFPAPSMAQEAHTDDDKDDLRDEARSALNEAQPFLPSPPQDPSTLDDIENDGYDEEETEEDILRRTLDTVRLEGGSRKKGEKGQEEENELDILRKALEEAEQEVLVPPQPQHPTRADKSIPDAVKDGGDSSLKEDKSEATMDQFPEIPIDLPRSEGEEEADDDDETKRLMDRLLGLSGPTTISLPKVPTSTPGDSHSKVTTTPGDSAKKEVGKGYGLHGWNDERDDDLDSWCCICNKDATLVCLGCDGDNYCNECWAEGHGPGGEVGHRTKRLVWGRKRALGA
ncbi:hypothetical protein BCR39DRAFT_601282 [Naematelia encephala]|uniref:Uncharacterized protein n=1 Tax=Naematelia encephala TaxID=71784 RepID=A0A1Y2AGP0_9TREE|nr:hypothetical protein BCR39DRAFT_601282 [Naematelia encephala]